MFRPDRRRRRAARASPWRFAAALAAVLAAAPAPAQDREGGSPTDLERQAEQDRERAEELRKKAAEVKDEVRALRSESVAVAKRAQELEGKLSELETTLADLKDRETAKLAALQDRRDQLAETLAALQRIAIQPPEALAMSSRSPLDVLRGGMVLGEMVPAIEQRAGRLRDELDELRDLREKIGTQREKLENTKAELASKRERLTKVVARKKELRQKLVGQSKAAAQRASQLADQAASLRELVAKLRAQPDRAPESKVAASPGESGVAPDADGGGSGGGADAAGSPSPDSGADQAATGGGGGGEGREGDVPPLPQTKPANLRGDSPEGSSSPDPGQQTRGQQTAKLTRPADVRAFPDSRESLRMPVSGPVVTRYGEQIERAGGKIAAKGIVIKARHGEHVVAPYDGKVAYAGPFKGYGRILIIEHGNRYHSLLAGLDRIDAVVGQWVLAGEPVGVMSETPARTPKLYMELRRTGRPINPLPWLAQTGNKVKG